MIKIMDGNLCMQKDLPDFQLAKRLAEQQIKNMNFGDIETILIVDQDTGEILAKYRSPIIVWEEIL